VRCSCPRGVRMVVPRESVHVRIVNAVCRQAGIDARTLAASKEAAVCTSERREPAELCTRVQRGARVGRRGDDEVVVQRELLQIEQQIEREPCVVRVGLRRGGRAHACVSSNPNVRWEPLLLRTSMKMSSPSSEARVANAAVMAAESVRSADGNGWRNRFVDGDVGCPLWCDGAWCPRLDGGA
jgi:hypothetical protein